MMAVILFRFVMIISGTIMIVALILLTMIITMSMDQHFRKLVTTTLQDRDGCLYNLKHLKNLN